MRLTRPVTLLLSLSLAATIVGWGCQRRVDAPLPEARYDVMPPAELPEHLQGTLLEYVTVFGTTPQVISGYGVVVNLENTGRDDGIPRSIRERILSNAARLGIASPRTGGQLGQLTPTALLSDPRTTVVRVEGYIPPAARKGQRIDVAVTALESNTTPSLARGKLWLTELYQGQIDARNPGEQVNQVGTARGPLMLNPVPTLLGPDEVAGQPNAVADLRRAVIPHGGVSQVDRPIILRLRSPDPRMARVIEERINFHFERVGGVARARDEALIELRLPRSREWANRGGDAWQHFLGVATHLYLRNDAPFVERQVEVLTQAARDAAGDPEALDSIGLAWQGLGPGALPSLSQLLLDEDPGVQFQAARAAAQLKHSGAIQVLAQIAGDATNPFNVQAARTFGELSSTVAVRRTCRNLLNASQAGNDQVRIAAYKSLTQLGFGRTGIEEQFVNDNFVLHLTPGDGRPIIYATRSGRPTIAVIGGIRSLPRVPRLDAPMLAFAFDRRLSIARQSEDDLVTLFQRENAPADNDSRPGGFTEAEVMPLLSDVLLRLGGERPGGRKAINLSYGDVVAVLKMLGDEQFIVAGLEGEETAVVRLEDPWLERRRDVAPIVPGLARPQTARSE